MEKYKWIFASSRGCEIEITEITCTVDEAKEYMLLKIAAEAESQIIILRILQDMKKTCR